LESVQLRTANGFPAKQATLSGSRCNVSCLSYSGFSRRTQLHGVSYRLYHCIGCDKITELADPCP
jgi:hypothetical protein